MNLFFENLFIAETNWPHCDYDTTGDRTGQAAQIKMEALSPRSTNQMIKPKPAAERKMGDKHAVAGAAQKTSSSKNHADPPPSIVTEPEDGGERYSIGAFLGKGGFAVCYEGKLSRNGRVFAMKVVRSQMPQKKMEEKVSLAGRDSLVDMALTIFTVSN